MRSQPAHRLGVELPRPIHSHVGLLFVDAGTDILVKPLWLNRVNLWRTAAPIAPRLGPSNATGMDASN